MRAGFAIVAAASLAALAGCGLFPGTSPSTTAAGPASPKPVSFGGVESATLRIETEGTFDPAPGDSEAEGTTGETGFQAAGSGFLISRDGLAVTNNHVVAGAAKLRVYIGSDKSDSYSAQILGSSECLDLAVLKVSGDGFPFLALQRTAPKVSQEVWTAGFPLDDPEFTMTKGIISKASANGDSSWSSLDSVLEDTARIHPGNSGGPLVSKKGEVVGVNYARDDEDDFNYAIPATTVSRAIGALSKGTPTGGVGLNLRAEDGSDGQRQGVWVTSVVSGSAADRAGVEPGDLITTMEGTPVGENGTLSDYCDVIDTKGAASTIKFELYREADRGTYAGEFNGDAASLESSSYQRVSGNGADVSAEMPALWADDPRGPLTWTDSEGDQFVGFTAATDAESFSDDSSVDGAMLLAAPSATSTSPDAVLKDWQSLVPSECDSPGEPASWSGAGYSGSYDEAECDGGSVIVYAGSGADDGDLVVLVMHGSDADSSAVRDHILQTIQYSGGD